MWKYYEVVSFEQDWLNPGFPQMLRLMSEYNHSCAQIDQHYIISVDINTFETYYQLLCMIMMVFKQIHLWVADVKFTLPIY